MKLNSNKKGKTDAAFRTKTVTQGGRKQGEGQKVTEGNLKGWHCRQRELGFLISATRIIPSPASHIGMSLHKQVCSV